MLTVKELREKLEGLEDEALVHIMVSPNMPVEHKCVAIKQRKDFSEWFDEKEKRNANDVFLIQGSQLRPGAKKAWE